jgi:hypothetical protein
MLPLIAFPFRGGSSGTGMETNLGISFKVCVQKAIQLFVVLSHLVFDDSHQLALSFFSSKTIYVPVQSSRFNKA